MLDCQLRKSEASKKTFEVATEKLLQFVEVKALSGNVVRRAYDLYLGGGFVCFGFFALKARGLEQN